MAHTLKVKDLVEYLELGKTRAELNFKLEILKCKDPSSADAKSCEEKLVLINKKIQELASMIQGFGADIPIPNENEISRLNSGMSELPLSDIAEAMKKRSGQIYELVAARGAIIKHNFENRENIAKLALLLLRFQKDIRMLISEAVRKSRIDSPIPVLKSEEAIGKKMACVLSRLGIPAVHKDGALVQSEGNGEVPVQVSNRTVWVTPEISEKLALNLKRIHELSPKIQLKNAVRFVQSFSDDEEKEYAQMQNDLLCLLKEQDELLKEFEEEKEMSIKIE